jgi:hypothetical protein
MTMLRGAILATLNQRSPTGVATVDPGVQDVISRTSSNDEMFVILINI